MTIGQHVSEWKYNKQWTRKPLFQMGWRALFVPHYILVFGIWYASHVPFNGFDIITLCRNKRALSAGSTHEYTWITHLWQIYYWSALVQRISAELHSERHMAEGQINACRGRKPLPRALKSHWRIMYTRNRGRLAWKGLHNRQDEKEVVGWFFCLPREHGLGAMRLHRSAVDVSLFVCF